MDITWSGGREAARRRCPTWRCSVARITGWCTKKVGAGANEGWSLEGETSPPPGSGQRPIGLSHRDQAWAPAADVPQGPGRIDVIASRPPLPQRRGKLRLVAYGGICDGRRRVLSGDPEGRVASPPRWLGSSENRAGAGGTGGAARGGARFRTTHGLSRSHRQHRVAPPVHHVFPTSDRRAAHRGCPRA